MDSLKAAVGLKTRHVQYDPTRELTIVDHDREHADSFAVLVCDGSDSALVQHFLRVASALPLEEATDCVEFDHVVRQVFALFRAFWRPGAGTCQGLWAELLLAAYAHAPECMVQAWHSQPGELHDFVGEGDRIEVKSSATALREHDFSLEQLERAGDRTLVASVLVSADEAGATVFDLLEHLLGRLATNELRLRAEGIVGAVLGDGWRDAQETRFGVKGALGSLHLVRAADVPRVPGPLPLGVRAVRFRADLSGVAAAEVTGHALAGALLPLAESE